MNYSLGFSWLFTFHPPSLAPNNTRYFCICACTPPEREYINYTVIITCHIVTNSQLVRSRDVTPLVLLFDNSSCIHRSASPCPVSGVHRRRFRMIGDNRLTDNCRVATSCISASFVVCVPLIDFVVLVVVLHVTLLPASMKRRKWNSVISIKYLCHCTHTCPLTRPSHDRQATFQITRQFPGP